ncbi:MULTISPECIES: uridylate kinase [unclassified Methanoregula]|uniref:uridylate kinase n=1 Tax=unclassified Methanoregula TaxID=2649730 RepID=UPI0009CC767B|nr:MULTISPECIES: uridylate kinase [unclassified Methanoregula]OPX61645.1 MAG: Amino acid kinase family protein [Methanoregula sp. PtaB.Bin085]OPY34046.1 MAG: Amino acid kinase family protein [Methanoregula sp. PtaU1.Bin006]
MSKTSSCRCPSSPLVVKLGGSLCPHVPELATVFRNSARPLVIVPGGGPFADAVRKVQTDDDSAHWMAVAAMDQYGWYISSYGIGTTASLQVPDRPAVLLPYCSVRQYDPLPHSWDVTSDSIAAWVANVLGLDLLVLKSVDGLFEQGNLMEWVTTRRDTDVVDPFFIPFVLKKKVTTTIINGACPGRVRHFLKGDVVPGTWIGTTF